MHHQLDITGQRFGSVVALEPDRPTRSGWLWICLCDCGNACSILAGALRSQNTASCGCIRSRKDRLPHFPGERFGRLVLVRRDHTSPLGAWFWLCQCDCGNSLVLNIVRLTSRNKKSCGCLRAEVLHQRNFRHGLRIRGMGVPEFQVYRSAKDRCTRPSNSNWEELRWSRD